MKEVRLLRADEIEVRMSQVNQKGVSLLCYKTARTDMDILDETFGAENWQKSYELIDGQLFCTISVWDEKKSQWISKQDVGTEANTEAEKSRASDAFKRAGFNFGIGRELYSSPFIYFKADEVKMENGKCYDKFEVLSIQYDGRKIKSIEVGDRTTGVVKTFSNNNAAPPPQKKQAKKEVKNPELYGLCKDNGVNPIWVAGKCGYNTLDEVPTDKADRCVKHWDELVSMYRKEMEQ